MKEHHTKKVVIINDIDSAEIERAILILKNGGTEQHSAYQIVEEAQSLICAYRQTLEKTNGNLRRKESDARQASVRREVANRILWAAVMMTGTLFGGYLLWQGVVFLIEKF